MALPVYSVRLFEALGLEDVVSFTCVEGFTTVIRDVDIFFYAHDTESGFSLAGALGQYFWVVTVPAGDGTTLQWRGRQVFNPGDTVGVGVGPGQVDVTISGYQLSLP